MNIIEENWDAILHHVMVEHEVTKVSFDTWLKPLKVHSFENNIVTILVDQQMTINYIQKKYALPIKVAHCRTDRTGLLSGFYTSGKYKNHGNKGKRCG